MNYLKKKEVAQKTLDMLEQKKKTESKPLLNLFQIIKIRTVWIYLKRPFAVIVIFIILSA